MLYGDSLTPSNMKTFSRKSRVVSKDSRSEQAVGEHPKGTSTNDEAAPTKNHEELARNGRHFDRSISRRENDGRDLQHRHSKDDDLVFSLALELHDSLIPTARYRAIEFANICLGIFVLFENSQILSCSVRKGYPGKCSRI